MNSNRFFIKVNHFKINSKIEKLIQKNNNIAEAESEELTIKYEEEENTLRQNIASE